MKNRFKSKLTLLVTLALILTTCIPVFADSSIIFYDIESGRNLTIEQSRDGIQNGSVKYENLYQIKDEQYKKLKNISDAEEEAVLDYAADSGKSIKEIVVAFKEKDVGVIKSVKDKVDIAQAKVEKKNLEEIEQLRKYKKALEAVEKAETEETKEAKDAAQVLVDELKDGTDKVDLQTRLDVLEELIKYKEALEAVKKAEAEETKEAKDVAQALVDALEDGTDKTDLQVRLDAVVVVKVEVTYFWVDAIIGGKFQGKVIVGGVEDLTGYTVKLDDNVGNVESDGMFDFSIDDDLVLRLTKEAEVLVIDSEGSTIHKESVGFKKKQTRNLD